MAAQSFSTGIRTNRVHIASANAGARDGTGASAGAAGTASGKTVVKKIGWAMTGGTNANTVLRIFLYDGTNYALQMEVPIQQNTVVIGGNVVRSGQIPIMQELASTSHKLAYSMETADAIDLVETLVDF